MQSINQKQNALLLFEILHQIFQDKIDTHEYLA